MSRIFPRVAGLVLAGGRSTRFGAEKAVADWRGRPLLAHVVDALAEGCGRLAVSAGPGSGAAAWAETAGVRVLPDPPGVVAGPLAGVLAGLRWLEGGAGDLLLTGPCDTPALPSDLAARLAAGLRDGAGAAYAHDGERAHPLCALWRADAAGLVETLAAGGAHLPMREVLAALGAVAIAFPDPAAFANVNTRDDLQRLTAEGGSRI